MEYRHGARRRSTRQRAGGAGSARTTEPAVAVVRPGAAWQRARGGRCLAPRRQQAPTLAAGTPDPHTRWRNPEQVHSTVRILPRDADHGETRLLQPPPPGCPAKGRCRCGPNGESGASGGAGTVRVREPSRDMADRLRRWRTSVAHKLDQTASYGTLTLGRVMEPTRRWDGPDPGMLSGAPKRSFSGGQRLLSARIPERAPASVLTFLPAPRQTAD